MLVVECGSSSCSIREAYTGRTIFRSADSINWTSENSKTICQITNYDTSNGIECIPTNRNLFLKAEHSIILEADEFRKNLKAGICPNQQLLEDFQKYGNENFQFFTVVMGHAFLNSDFLESEFKKCQNNWVGPQY